ncbi:hypothetical protein FHR81_004083 [Actinoalloteichus hoggarensis]|uniref:Uncharacterized protein n=1 Tax=Actinoalloteichus hoggarensis TaxID=1470176 RepID=A0A221W951_9PSEU|nr:hypothetical protein [Actinoalloteichus hoggarensis]ASO22560.1 hypothetical protein AHOG_24775 [Actinoalloteichus hoggarensis]MBB5923016.1 hypothetical protein [Actinoalloteichus hoggarensis]
MPAPGDAGRLFAEPPDHTERTMAVVVDPPPSRATLSVSVSVSVSASVEQGRTRRLLRVGKSLVGMGGRLLITMW